MNLPRTGSRDFDVAPDDAIAESRAVGDALLGQPNGILKVTPAFLESVIEEVRAAGFEIISLDDVKARLNGSAKQKPFTVFTLDDGYRDNRDRAYPVFNNETSAGDREFEIARTLGVETAVTTRKGLIRRSHAVSMTALPRLPLNGDYQDVRYVRALLSGLPFALRDGARRMAAPLSGVLLAG